MPVPPTCEYKVGKWCSSPLPPYTDRNSCKAAAGNCLIQFATCFLTAGFPESLNCLQFKAWCFNVNSFCGNQCPGSNCSHSSCKQKYPPVSPPQPTPVVSTSIGPCATTTTAKTTTTTTRAATTTSSVPIPQPTDCLCEQPHNPAKGYTRDDALGDVDLTCVACNNDKNDWKSGNYFKLYNNPDSRKCGGYNQPVEACKQACADQYKGYVLKLSYSEILRCSSPVLISDMLHITQELTLLPSQMCRLLRRNLQKQKPQVGKNLWPIKELWKEIR